MGFVARLREHGARDGRVAVVTDRGSIDWPAFFRRVESEAAALQAAGLGQGATVGISIADEVEHFVASLALIRAGAWQIALATHDTEQERVEIAERARVTHVLLGARGEPNTGDRPHVSWPQPAVPHVAEVPEGGVFLRTSGTTGSSNIVPLTGADLAVQAGRNVEYGNGRLLRPAAIEHNNSKRHRLYCAAMGGTNVFRPEGSYDLAEFCAETGVTTLDLALMQAADLASVPRTGFENIDVRVSGSAIPCAVRDRIQQNVTRRLYVRYGSTESGTVAIAGPGEHDEAESVGRIVAGLELQIVDATGNRLPSGEAGEIRMRGDGIASGYFEGPEQTARRYRDGWYWPGDLGRLRDDGSLQILGRADDMINLNGINIFPSEIERVLEQHPAVRVAAALPLTSGIHGQIPVAAVELNQGGMVSERELVTYAREHLALRAPRRIIIVDNLPRNSQGKILRRELAVRFVRGTPS